MLTSATEEDEGRPRQDPVFNPTAKTAWLAFLSTQSRQLTIQLWKTPQGRGQCSDVIRLNKKPRLP